MMRMSFVLAFMTVGFTLMSANISYDFSQQEEFHGQMRRATIKDGILFLKRDARVSLPINTFKKTRLSFKYKIVKTYPAKHKNNHMTLTLTGNGGQQTSIHLFSERSMMCYVRKNGETKEAKGLKRGTKFIFEKNKWYDVIVDVWQNKLNINVAKQNLITLKHEKMLPITKISFSSYQQDTELDDLKIADKSEKVLNTVGNAVFLADFSNTLDGIDEDGKKLVPEAKGTVKFVTGVDGKAVTFLQDDSFRGNSLVYPLDEPLLNQAGGIMFWVKKNKNRRLFQLTDAEGKAKLSATIGGDWLNAVKIFVKQVNDKHPLAYIRSVAGSLNDWIHVALTWDKDLNARFFINGLPYSVSFRPGQRCPDFLHTDVKGIKKLIFGNKTDAAFDRFRIFKRTLTNQEIYDEYRSIMPVDMVMDRIIVDEDRPVKLQVNIAPGGFYMRPMPVETKTFIPADVSIKFALKNDKGELIHEEEQHLNVDQPLDVELKQVTLPKGNYTLVATVKYKDKLYQRSFDLTAFTQKYKSEVTSEPLKQGRLIYERKLDTVKSDILSEGKTHIPAGKQYLQAGNDKGNRFCFEIPFEEDVLGKPVILEITWPDDQIRSMGWYMYPHGLKVNRDRLQTGVQAGNEFPNSGKLVSTRHIFYPGVSKYLFEARTMASGMPAAVADVKVYAIDGALPKLAINYPKGVPGRRYGHSDEDQTFTNNLNVDITSAKSSKNSVFSKDYAKNKTAFFTDELVRYFGYTGMNLMHYPVWRYVQSFIPLEGHTGNGLYPGRSGELSYVFERFADNNLKFIAIMNYTNLPDLANLDKIQANYIEEGMVVLDRYGDNIKAFAGGKHLANICHPKVLDLFFRYFENPVKRYSQLAGFGGIEYNVANLGTWRKLDYGYDDYTVNKFSEATGIKVPEKITERYDFLTKEPVRKKWLRWRADQVTNLVRGYRAVLDKYKPDLKLFLNIPQDENNYVERGIDYRSLKSIPGVSLTVCRNPTGYRHDFHWGRPESTSYERLYNFHSRDLKNYLQNGVAASVNSFHHYFETFVHPLNKDYKCYFENSDVKAHGRYFLREFAFAVGAFDAQQYTLGGQPLGAVGREDESREFAKAYCALPAKPFKRISGICDPVVGRFLQTENGTYFYVVNMFHYPVKVRFDSDKNIPYRDLSSNQEIGENMLELKPFQLRSFFFPKENVVVSNLAFVETSPEADRFYKQRITTLKNAASILKQGNITIPQEEQTIAQLERLLKNKHYAELYRLAFSRDMNQLLKKLNNLDAIISKQKMIKAGHYAVNCGSSQFYQAPNGTYFFPDQAFNGTYGYYGKLAKSCTREISGLTGTGVPELYKTEAYDIDGYKFKLPNGKYKITFYMKCGWKPTYDKPNVFRFTIKANGKTILDKYDLYKESKGDFHKALKETVENINVTNGELVLEYKAIPFRSPTFTTTARLANAIEVVKQQ